MSSGSLFCTSVRWRKLTGSSLQSEPQKGLMTPAARLSLIR